MIYSLVLVLLRLGNTFACKLVLLRMLSPCFHGLLVPGNKR